MARDRGRAVLGLRSEAGIGVVGVVKSGYGAISSSNSRHLLDVTFVRCSGSVIKHEIESADEWTFPQDSLELRMTSRVWRIPRRLDVLANPDGSLVGVILSGDTFRGYANVFKVDATTLRIEFPRTALGRNVRSYRWRLLGTGGGGGGCGEGLDCEGPPPDRLPDSGSVRHAGLHWYNE